MQSTCIHRLRHATFVLALGTFLCSGHPAVAAQPDERSATDVFDIDVPAQTLSQAIALLSQQTHTPVLALSTVVAGTSSRAVLGRMTVQQALDHMLEGTAVKATREGNAMVIRASTSAPSPRTLAEVQVTAATESDSAAALQSDGRTANGYRAKTLSSLGALGSMRLQDTPFAVSVIPMDLMQNIQAQSPDDVYKLNPSTRTSTPQISTWSPAANIRGFDGYNTAEDGLRRAFNHGAVLEDKERVEIMSGLSGFMFGAAQPGGMVNFVYKRPTIDRLNDVTVGNYGGKQYYVHGDFGGRLDEAGRVGYRLNVVRQDGSTAVDDQSITRTLVSAAIDWQVTDKLLWEMNAVHNEYAIDASSAYWMFKGATHGSAPDARLLWSQPWIRDDRRNTSLTNKLIYHVNDTVSLRASYMDGRAQRFKQDHSMNRVTVPGQYEQLRSRAGRTNEVLNAGSLFADVNFKTGTLAHKVTLGYYMFGASMRDTHDRFDTGWTGPYPIDHPTYVPEPVFPALDTRPHYFGGRDSNKNFLIGDHITFNERWSVLLGLNRSTILAKVREPDGTAPQPDYNQTKTSPSASLMFKPFPWLTTYATYIEGLEMGGTAPDTAENASRTMPPMISRQKEAGAKAVLGGMLLSAAAFDIEKAFEHTDAMNIYTQSGRRAHTGVELNATGKLNARWTLLAGATVLNARIKQSEFAGKSPENVASILAKVYAEYAVPVPGLVLTGGVFLTGKQWADAANTDRLPAVVTADVGVRYATRAAGRPLTLRLNVANLTNKSYWLNSYYTGAPRSIALSAQMRF